MTTPAEDVRFRWEEEVLYDPPRTTVPPPKILWSCIARNATILVEATAHDLLFMNHELCWDHYGVETDDDVCHAVRETAYGLLARKATAGYEFHQPATFKMASFSPRRRQSSSSSSKSPRLTSLFRNSNKNSRHRRRHSTTTTTSSVSHDHAPAPTRARLRGCKFHVYEHDTEHPESCLLIWVFAAVYDASVVEQAHVQAFLQKMVTLTEVSRTNDEYWRYGSSLACQATFAPILQQNMEEVTYLGKMAALQEQLAASREIMRNNIELLLDREAILRDQLHEKSTTLQEMAAVFHKKARRLKRIQMWHNAKHGILLGTALTAGVAVCVVPPLVVLL